MSEKEREEKRKRDREREREREREKSDKVMACEDVLFKNAVCTISKS